MIEIWKDVPGYEGKYQASNFGRIKSLNRIIMRSNGWPLAKIGKILKPTLGKNKYHIVSLGKNGKDKKLVHRIIAETFLKKDPKRNHVDHINSIRTDNRVENLQWVTQQENNAKQKRSLGSEHYNSLLKKSDVIHIRYEFHKLSQKNEYGLYTKIAKGYGINMVTVHDIIKKRTWKHV